MKGVYFLALLLFCTSVCLGQNNNDTANHEVYGNSRDTIGIVQQTDQYASYQGGNNAWTHYLIRNLDAEQSIAEMQRKKVKEQTAVIQFVVCTDGTICEVKVVNEVLPSVRREAERVVKKSGKWVPGKKDGKEVKSYIKQSIQFVNYN